MQGKSKLKLLYIKDYLEAFSDEDNPVSAEEMIEMLREKGIECERKSIYSDIENLRRYGLEIFRVRAPKNGYFIGQGNFQTAELRILTDAVQAAEFITPQKTRELTEKIKTLCSAGRAKKLDSQMYIDGRAKCRNEQIYYNIDVLSRAIESGRQVSFIYSKRVVNGESAEIIREEKELTISPYAMLWSNDRYYLVGNNPKYDNLMHVRIDRMRHVEMTQSASRHFSEVSPYRNFLIQPITFPSCFICSAVKRRKLSLFAEAKRLKAYSTASARRRKLQNAAVRANSF